MKNETETKRKRGRKLHEWAVVGIQEQAEAANDDHQGECQLCVFDSIDVVGNDCDVFDSVASYMWR